MIRDSFKAFLVGISLSFTSVFFAQQKITVLDETSGFPIHDVQVIIEYSGSNVMDPIRQEKTTIDRAGLEQYFTNKLIRQVKANGTKTYHTKNMHHLPDNS